MKKIVLIAFILTTCLTNAQVRNYNKNAPTVVKKANFESVKKQSNYNDTDDSSSKIGIVAGLLISNEVGDGIETSAPRTGFYAGLAFKPNFSEKLGLEFDLVYATMGAEFQGELKDELTYLQLPITLNAKVFNVVILQVGPQVGYLLSANFDGTDYIDTLNKIDYGIVAGLGVEFPNTNFGLTGKFYYGLSDINKEASSIGEINNTSYSIGVFYNF